MGAKSIFNTLPEEVHERYWFYVKDNASNGPFTQSELEKKINEGALGPNDFCWRHGFEEWRSLAATQEFHENFTSVSAPLLYPKIDVPSRLELRIVNALQKKEEGSRKRVVVQLAKAKKYYFSLYEWTIALLFALGLSYFSASFALKEVLKGVTLNLLQHNRGQLEEIGFNGDSLGSLTVKFMEPMLSAPGALSYPFAIPVSIEGFSQGKEGGSSSFTLGTHIIKSQEPLIEESEFSSNLDSVYRYPIKAHGELFLGRPQELLVNNPGSPLVFSH